MKGNYVTRYTKKHGQLLRRAIEGNGKWMPVNNHVRNRGPALDLFDDAMVDYKEDDRRIWLRLKDGIPLYVQDTTGLPIKYYGIF